MNVNGGGKVGHVGGLIALSQMFDDRLLSADRRQLVLPVHCLNSNIIELRSHKVSWQIQSRNWR